MLGSSIDGSHGERSRAKVLATTHLPIDVSASLVSVAGGRAGFEHAPLDFDRTGVDFPLEIVNRVDHGRILIRTAPRHD
jgi:hypothetical protein